jgi:hypothetical protein
MVETTMPPSALSQLVVTVEAVAEYPRTVAGWSHPDHVWGTDDRRGVRPRARGPEGIRERPMTVPWCRGVGEGEALMVSGPDYGGVGVIAYWLPGWRLAAADAMVAVVSSDVRAPIAQTRPPTDGAPLAASASVPAYASAARPGWGRCVGMIALILGRPDDWLAGFAVRRDWPCGTHEIVRWRATIERAQQCAWTDIEYRRTGPWRPLACTVVSISRRDFDLHAKRHDCRSPDCPTVASVADRPVQVLR